ncbi:ABC-type transport system, involved in lipoprotein release, permease component [Reichenbachiella faecimaris]|uniref:ABC-type transport system, involved in lipoprotein release, permease component n=1 Tax=Reichenbachiella faecimaris TaxID=692418 RepID=A0A1W2GNS2_REIFA|nr:ABC transporter permease [Reichenbachiella faecimaris]SMD38305.1 ABC-type transport system, involved in lipoprotein release, permease component [Reichenbachiella faecimaris]
MKKSSYPKPPYWISKCLQWWSNKADTEDLLGDLEEDYQYNLEDKGKFKAQLNYLKQVLSLAFSYALRKRKRSASYSNYYNSNSIAMFNNYFKIAFRNFSKHKFFTSINIIGLALGMSISLLVLSISIAIYKSDDWQEKKDRIFQINTFIADERDTKTYGSTFHAVGDHLQEKYPFIESVVKIKDGFDPVVKHQGSEMNFYGHFANSSFFKTFSFQLISGDPQTALSEPFSIVLTESVAKKLYRDENPLGRIIETELGAFNITGVIEDLHQTHFFFEVLASYQTFDALETTTDLKTDWKNFRDNYVYLLLKPETPTETLAQSLEQMSTLAGEFNPNQDIQFEYIVLPDVVPRWNISNALGIGWDQPSLIFFMSIGLLILLPAVFNYSNLSIARALKRGKEIGIRKVVGAEKRQIKAQFIIETILLSLLALLASFFIFVRIQEEFLGILGASQVLDTSIGFTLIVAFILFAVVIGALAGIFPAAYFSRLNPVHTLKGGLVHRSANVSHIKKGLLIFQFFVSLVFIIGVSALTKEYSYVLNTQHGFASDNTLVIPFQEIDKQLAINELKNHPAVKSISVTSNLPGVPLSPKVEATLNGRDTINIKQVFVGDNFIENLDMKLAWGENKGLINSTKNEELVIVNEAFMQLAATFLLGQDSVRFTMADRTKCRIIGTLEDFNFEPLDQLIQPLVFRHSLDRSKFALLTINTSDIKTTIDELDEIWTSIDQEAYFEATFLDEEIEDAYYFLRVQIKFFSFLSAFAISISCLGLLGMVSYTTENRTKEIAIRKIMGASSQSLYYLLTKDFLKLILIAAVIAIPFSYVFYDQLFLYFLLRYGNGLGVLDVIFSIVFLFIIGFASIYWQTSKVAHANSANNLRYE